ncbi:hypothetical protein BsWGS_16596 [Bradybaena similaris]
MAGKVTHVVADAGAFIRNAPLRDIAENVYTVPEVILESCDRATRRRLKVFPVDIKFKEPSSDALSIVTSFSKKTGDYRSLSAVDLKVLALVYDLEKQFKGTEHIRKEPPTQPEWAVGHKTGGCGVTIATKRYEDGEALPADQIGEEKETDSDDDDEEYFDAAEALNDALSSVGLAEEGINDRECGNLEDENNKERAIVHSEVEDEEVSDDVEDISDDDDDDEGWITPANIVEVKRSMGIETAPVDDICVGCLTTDFAMQNVLIQMGLRVLSVDGLLIKRAKSYVLRCHGCMRITKDTSKMFCPHCGNKTLKRLSTTIEEDGSVRYWLAKNYTIRTRGTKYSLPKPQGGKHALNPQLCADQPRPDQRPSKKSLQKVDILSADIIADMSPFSINDVTSRAAQLGIRDSRPPQWSKRNPNESHKKVNKRKGK